MYDIEFIIPVSTQGKYLQRLFDFCQIGLMNIGNKKVLLTLLANEENRFSLNIDSKIELNWVTCRHNHPASKIYSYFSSMHLDQVEQVRWFAKFDDDSVNDISTLVDKLDRYFDHERDYYIVTELRNEVHPIDRDIMIAGGFGDFFGPGSRPPIHEKEASCISQSALRRILSNPIAIDLMETRSKLGQGWGDVFLAYISQMVAHVYPSQSNFMTSNPQIADFSIVGGEFARIHFVAADVNAKIHEFLKCIVAEENSKTRSVIVGKPYTFWRGDEILDVLKLLPNHRIDGSKNKNEFFWMITPDEELCFLSDRCDITTTFKNVKGSYEVLEGDFSFDRNVRHFLRGIHG